MSDEWIKGQLGNFVQIGSSKRIFYNEYVPEGVPFYRSKEVIEKRSGKNVSTELYILHSRFQEIKTKFGVPHKGDILLTSVGTLGVPWIVDTEEDFYFKDGNLTWFKDFHPRLNNRFLFYWLISPTGKNELEMSSIGSTQAALTIKGLKELSISIPPIDEQIAIISILSALDDKIDLLHRQNRTLESLAQALFRHWFIDGAGADWDDVTVGEFTKINETSISKDYAYSQIEYLDTGSITEGKISGFQEFSLAEAPSRARRLVKHDDVIISTVRPNQKHYGIIKNPQPNLVVSTGFCVVSCDKIDPHFVYLLLTQSDMTEYLHSVAEGSTSTYPSLKPSDIAGVEFQLPPQERLTIFSDIARSIWAKIDQNATQIRTLAALRDSLLPKLMGGEVRVRL